MYAHRTGVGLIILIVGVGSGVRLAGWTARAAARRSTAHSTAVTTRV